MTVDGFGAHICCYRLSLQPMTSLLKRLTRCGAVLHRLTGTISRMIGGMPYLIDIDMNNNQLSGPIDESLWYMPRLDRLELGNNRLTGTLSPAIG